MIDKLLNELVDVDRERIEEIGERLLRQALAEGAAGADVLFSASSGHGLSLREGKPEKESCGITSGIGLRTIDGEGRQGVAYVNVLEKDAVDNLVGWSLHNCRLSEPDPDAVLYEGPPPADMDLETVDPEVLKISPAMRMERCREMNDIAAHSDSRIASVRSAAWNDGIGAVFYASSSGASNWHCGTVVSCGVAVVMNDGQVMEMGGYGDESRFLSALNHREIAATAVDRTAMILGGRKIPTGGYDIVLDRSEVASLLDVIGEFFLASNVHKNMSMLKGKMGSKVASDCLSIVDDGLLRRGLASMPFDGEGVPCGRTELLRDGVVENFLYNLKYARKDGVPSTGNAARGISTLPDIDVSNLFILPGASSRNVLIKQVGSGIYVTELMGLHTINPVSGEYSLGAKGVRITDGGLAEPVAGITIAGNLRDLLQKITDVGDDLKFYGSTGGCTLVVRELAVAGS